MNKLINKKTIAFLEIPLEVRTMMDHWVKQYPAAHILTLMMELDRLEDYIYTYDKQFQILLENYIPEKGNLLVHGFSEFQGPLPIGFINSILEGQIRKSADGYAYFADFTSIYSTYCVPFFVILDPKLNNDKGRIKGNIDFDNILYWVCPDGLKDFVIFCLKKAVHMGLTVNGKTFAEADFQKSTQKLISYRELKNI